MDTEGEHKPSCEDDDSSIGVHGHWTWCGRPIVLELCLEQPGQDIRWLVVLVHFLIEPVSSRSFPNALAYLLLLHQLLL